MASGLLRRVRDAFSKVERAWNNEQNRTNDNMKTLRITLLAALGVLLFQSASLEAGERYKINLRATVQTTNDLREIVTVPVSSAAIIRECAVDHSLDPQALTLVYDKDTEEVLVVNRSNGTNVCTVLQFEDDVSIPNAAGTRWARYVKISDPENGLLSGRAVGTRRITRDLLGNVLTFKFHGKFFLKVEETDTERARVYSGTFSTGSRFVTTSP